MNDKELDEKVRQLFDADTISVDVDGEAARALLEDIVDGGVASPNEPNLLAEAQADDDPSSATDVVVDLRSGRGSMSGELDANRRVRSLVAVAAVLALVVVLITGIVLSREDGTLAVISDDGRADTADAVEFPVAERIDGPEEPLLILAPEASAIAEIDTCIERTSEFDSGGLGLVTFASVDDPSGFAPGWVVLSDGISLRECSIDENSQENYSSTPSLLFDEELFPEQLCFQ